MKFKNIFFLVSLISCLTFAEKCKKYAEKSKEKLSTAACHVKKHGCSALKSSISTADHYGRIYLSAIKQRSLNIAENVKEQMKGLINKLTKKKDQAPPITVPKTEEDSEDLQPDHQFDINEFMELLKKLSEQREAAEEAGQNQENEEEKPNVEELKDEEQPQAVEQEEAKVEL